MPFRIKKREPVADGLRRSAAEQLSRAASALRDAPHDPASIHKARVRIKRTRAILALADRSMGPAARDESRALRDTAALLAAPRDAASMLHIFALLRERFGSLDPAAFDHLALLLESAASPATPATTSDPTTCPIHAAADRLEAAAQRAALWAIDGAGFNAIEHALLKSYTRARKGRRAALWGDDPEARHAWRTRLKRLAAQLRLIRGLWPQLIDPHTDLLRQIADHLGDDHDLWLLATALRTDPARYGQPDAVLAIARLAQRAGNQIAHAQRAPSRRALAEKPDVFIKRIRAHWRAWRDD